jgi:hypothetical protein
MEYRPYGKSKIRDILSMSVLREIMVSATAEEKATVVGVKVETY